MNSRQWFRGISVLATGLTMSLVFVLCADAAVIGSVNNDGIIVLMGDGEVLQGLSFKSQGGYLLPIPPGDATADADPFMFLLANDTDQVVFASLSNLVTLDGTLITGVGYSAPPGTDLRVDLADSVWGNSDISPTPFKITFVPEPVSSLLILIGALGLLGYRRHRDRGSNIPTCCL